MSPKKVDLLPEKVVSPPKTIDSFPENFSFLCLLIPNHIRVNPSL